MGMKISAQEIAVYFEKSMDPAQEMLLDSNKLSESLFSLCGLAAGVQFGHALILCGGLLVLFSGCLVQS